MTERQILMQFLDGPLAGRGNLPDALGRVHTFAFSESSYGWPLPERLCVLAHLEQTSSVAIWDPTREHEMADPLPPEITESPNRVTYIKIGESRITDEQAALMAHVVRGAKYRLERADRGST